MLTQTLRAALLLILVTLAPIGSAAATQTVNSTADSGTGSLRQAITTAASGDTIQFQFATTPVTISLNSGDLEIDKNLTITGLGTTNLIIDGGGNQSRGRVLTVGSSATVSISGLTVKGGRGGGTGLGSIDGDGGGIYNLGHLTLTNVVVSNNTAANFDVGGGGILNVGTLSLVGSTVSNNTAGGKASLGTNGAVTGGGVRNANIATLTVTNSTISNNFAQIGGGIFNTGSMTITGSTFASNSAGVGVSTNQTLEGGAIFINSPGTGSIVNSTFFGNSAKDDGGAIANNGNISTSFSTFVGNSARNGNGVSATHNTLTLKANIFSNNGANCLISGGSIVSDGHNLATDSTCNLTATGDLPNTAAGLDPAGLQNNGGSTQTVALLSTSAAVDKISTPCTDAGASGVSADQRGTARPQGTNCDIGAFELEQSTQASTTTVTNTNDDSNPGSLRYAIANAIDGDTINFDLTYPATITLGTAAVGDTALRIDKSLTIRGPGASNLTIQGNGNLQLFLVVSGVTASVSGLTIQNGAFGDGNGGGFFNNGTLNLTNCVISNNQSGQGGGINNQQSGILTVSSSTISGNTASMGAGIYNAGTATVNASTLSSNTANDAAGIYNGGTLTITNSTFAGNQANTAVGAIENTGTLHLSNSTLFNNSSISIGGIFANTGTITVKGTLVAKGSVGDNCAVSTGTITSQGYNLSDDTSCPSFSDPTDLNNTAAGLSSGGLQNNGGPTQTVALLANSAAFDAIPTASCTDVDGNTLATDQRGTTRPQQGGCDIGAYELVLGAPIITSFTPSSGVAGTSVTITGTGFTAASTVAFNNTSAASTTVNSDTQITAAAPNGVTTGTIAVTTVAGTGVSSTSFTVIPQPAITSFTPTSGGAGKSVTITGTGFTGATQVTIGGASASFTINSDTQITAAVPSNASTGTITVTTGGGTATSSSNFTFIPAPTVSSFTPASGGVTATVTITGTAFTGASLVSFNNTTANFTVNSDTQITATVPSSATSGPIGVTTGGGTATSNSSFTVVANAPPTISSFTPASGGVGTAVTISGNNLKGAIQVAFNGASAGFKFSGMKIIASVPANASNGPISVTTPGGIGLSVTNFTFVATPTVTGFSPLSGPVGAQITITGTNFTGASSVMFGSKTATFTVVDGQTISATVPKGAKSGQISVTTPGGKATSSGSFVVN